ncbi:MAG: hypothetical protein QXQ66_09915 [Candidatus Hadarchaeum sp.]
MATGTLGKRLPPHYGLLGDQGLRTSRVSSAPSTDPLVSLYHEPIGAYELGGKAAGQGGGVFWQEALVKLLYLVLSHLNERLEGLRLHGFAKALAGNYHAD